MSRIGKKPVKIPAGVEVSVNGDLVEFKKGSVQKVLDTKGNVDVNVQDGELVFISKGADRQSSAFWGTYRALGQNVITGLTEGFKKQLEINEARKEQLRIAKETERKLSLINSGKATPDQLISWGGKSSVRVRLR